MNSFKALFVKTVSQSAKRLVKLTTNLLVKTKNIVIFVKIKSMKLLIFTALSLAYFTSLAQQDHSVKEYYDEIFEVSKQNYQGRSILSSSVKELPQEHPLAKIVNKNKIYLQYWLVNYIDREKFHSLSSIEEEEELEQGFQTFLKNDSLFNPLMIRLSEKAVNPKFVADTVSVDEVLNVAVKYFNILGITEGGHYKGKVCSGLNGISETLPERKPHLEAFCFSAILRNLKGEEYNMYNEFVAAIRELYKQDLGIDKDARLLRAQGAMFSLMRNNEQLKKMLLSDYESRKDVLPFVIANSGNAKKG
jgi:hypothetical protein